jgi:NADH-quinone oxidoreductase subunit J
MLGTGTESALVIDIAFWIIAASSIVAAIAVVQLRDLFRAAMFLVVSFFGVAGMFVLLRAEFLAVVQVLIYVGAISVLIIFAILMVRDVEQGSPPNRLRIPAGVLALLFFLATSFVALSTDWNLIDDVIPQAGGAEIATTLGGAKLPADTVSKIEEVYSNTVPQIAELLLSDYVLAFEVASVLLLATVIGALALIRER